MTRLQANAGAIACLCAWGALTVHAPVVVTPAHDQLRTLCGVGAGVLAGLSLLIRTPEALFRARVVTSALLVVAMVVAGWAQPNLRIVIVCLTSALAAAVVLARR